MFKTLEFTPLPGLASPHLQMFVANFAPTGSEPPSSSLHVKLNDGDLLSCEISTPDTWISSDSTIVLVHGVGGSHLSSYMIRTSRKFYKEGYRVVRINLRGCGSGDGLNKRPYNCGNSHDIQTVLETLKKDNPESKMTLIGFSMGGSLIIKMAGEMGGNCQGLVDRIIAICPVLDLIETVQLISKTANWLYHKYYLKQILVQGRHWINNNSISSIPEMDEKVTAPLWGYKNAEDYYKKCSSCNFISNVQVPLDIILSADDPFVDHNALRKVKLSHSTQAWLTSTGSHVAFIGKSTSYQDYHWIDQLLLDWIKPYRAQFLQVEPK